MIHLRFPSFSNESSCAAFSRYQLFLLSKQKESLFTAGSMTLFFLLLHSMISILDFLDLPLILSIVALQERTLLSLRRLQRYITARY